MAVERLKRDVTVGVFVIGQVERGESAGHPTSFLFLADPAEKLNLVLKSPFLDAAPQFLFVGLRVGLARQNEAKAGTDVPHGLNGHVLPFNLVHATGVEEVRPEFAWAEEFGSVQGASENPIHIDAIVALQPTGDDPGASE